VVSNDEKMIDFPCNDLVSVGDGDEGNKPQVTPEPLPAMEDAATGSLLLAMDEDDDAEEEEGEARDDEEAMLLQRAFHEARRALQRRPCAHEYVIESLTTIASLPLKVAAVEDMQSMLSRMPGFPADCMRHDVERFVKFYANLVCGGTTATANSDAGRVLVTESNKRVMLYRCLMRATTGCALDAEEGRLLMTLGAKSFVVAMYALMNEFDFPRTPDIFKTTPGVGVDASDLFDRFLGSAFRKGCRLLNLQPDEVASIEDDCVSKNELLYLISARR
jgi:hypothetical protein